MEPLTKDKLGQIGSYRGFSTTNRSGFFADSEKQGLSLPMLQNKQVFIVKQSKRGPDSWKKNETVGRTRSKLGLWSSRLVEIVAPPPPENLKL